MRVMFNFYDGSKLSQECREVGFSEETSFDVSLDIEYVVYGISFWRKIIFYLICDDYKLPNWYPSEIFKIVNNDIPNNWKFVTKENSNEYSVKALLGYPELIEIEEHYAGLIERDKVALDIFANVASK